ncbi:MAG: cbb3-type cytochrome c oxidase subunit I [Conexivisphaerales archaeon]
MQQVEAVYQKRSWLKRWLFTTYHKDIGILYFVTSLYFAFVAGLLAALMRVQLSAPGNTFLGPTEFNSAVTAHGLIMILWFLSPLGVAFANYIVPMQIGADDLAFPRLNALSYWLFLISGMMLVMSFFMPGGGFGGGWTTYAPLSTAQYSPGPGPSLAFMGFILLCVSITVGSVNFITTILWKRAPGMGFREIPMFTWFTFFTQVLMLMAFPSLLAALLLLMSDRLLGTQFFAASSGGALLWDNLFWFFGHPEVYVVLLPAFGAILEILPTFTGRPLAARTAILVAAGFLVVPLSVYVFAHHEFVTGIPLALREGFTITTFAISVPFDVMVLSMIHSLTGGRIKLKTPMLFAIAAVIIFIIGGITGVFLASFVLDINLRGTYFVVAHFHYVMAGATIFGLFAATYYWLPKMTNHMYSERLGKIHFITSFISFNVLYFPMFLLYEMPRRIYTYQASTGWGTLNYIASIGGFVFIASQVFFLVNLLIAVRGKIPTTPNPWHAITPEWVPGVFAPAGLLKSMPNGVGNGNTETHSEGTAAHHQHLSQRPLALASGAALTLTGLALSSWNLGLPFLGIGNPFFFAGLALLAWAVIGWAHDDMIGKFKVPDEERGERWPSISFPKVKLGIWTFLASEVLVFGSILSSYLYVRAYSTAWPAPGSIHSITIGTINTVVLLSSSLTALLALRAARSGDRRGLLAWIGLTFALGSTFLAVKGFEWYDLIYNLGFTPHSGLPGTTYFFIVGLHGAHVFAGLMVMLYIIRKAFAGKITKENHQVVELFGLYWSFVDIVWIFIFPLFYLM